jgi:hypothetical protein
MIGKMIRRALFAAGASYVGRHLLRRRGRRRQDVATGSDARAAGDGVTYETEGNANRGWGTRAESIAGAGTGSWTTSLPKTRSTSPLGGAERRLR